MAVFTCPVPIVLLHIIITVTLTDLFILTLFLINNMVKIYSLYLLTCNEHYCKVLVGIFILIYLFRYSTPQII